jgi:hypothetical protein
MEFLIPFVALGGLYTITQRDNRHAKYTAADNDDDATMYAAAAADGGGGGYAAAAAQESLSPTPAPVERTGFVMPPPAAADAPMPFAATAMGTTSTYDGGPSYLTEILQPRSLGGGASAAPFFSGAESYASRTPAASASLTLDNYTGAGSLYRKKEAMAPLFAPTADLSYAYGAPNQTDLVRERTFVSDKRHGERAGPQIHEGRGLTLDRSAAGMVAELGSSAPHGLVDYQSRGTYIDALAARDLYADRTVDQLRTAINPKADAYSMAGFEGPAMNPNASGRRLDDAPTPKNRPDTFFENVLGLWRGAKSFRHTQSLAPEFVAQPDTQRWRTEEEFEGGSGFLGHAQGVTGGLGGYVMEQEVEPAHKLEPGEMPMGQVGALTGAAPAAINDYSRYTQPVFGTHRSSGPQQTYFGAAFSSVLGKFAAPIADALMMPARPDAARAALAEASNDTHGMGQFSGVGLGGFGSGTADARGPVAAEYLLPPTLKDEGLLEDYFGQATVTDLGMHHEQGTRLRATERERTTAHSTYLGAAQGQVPASGAEAMPAAQPREDRQREQVLQGRTQQGNIDRYNPNAGTMGHRKPDAAPATRAPVASFAAAVPSAATFGAVVSKYEHAPVPAASGKKRSFAAANADDAVGSGGGSMLRAGAPTRAKHPAEHDFSGQADVNAQMRSMQAARNPLVQSYRVR